MSKIMTKNLLFASTLGFVALALVVAVPSQALAWCSNYGYNCDQGVQPPSYRTYYPNGYSYTFYQPGIASGGQYTPTPYIPTPPVWSLPPSYTYNNNNGYYYQPGSYYYQQPTYQPPVYNQQPGNGYYYQQPTYPQPNYTIPTTGYIPRYAY